MVRDELAGRYMAAQNCHVIKHEMIGSFEQCRNCKTCLSLSMVRCTLCCKSYCLNHYLSCNCPAKKELVIQIQEQEFDAHQRELEEVAKIGWNQRLRAFGAKFNQKYDMISHGNRFIMD